KAMDGDTFAAVRQLVRDVASLNVVITDRPESINFNRRVWPQMLSVPRTSLFALFHDEAPKAEWIAKSAREQDVMQTGVIEIDWEEIVRSADLMSAGWLIAIHPDCASYDSKLGLVI